MATGLTSLAPRGGIISRYCCSVYPPKKHPQKRNYWTTLLKYRNCGLLICGDFNKAKTTRICDQQLVNVVKQPTRCDSTLDLILSNLSEWYKNSEILPPVGMLDLSTVLWRPKPSSSISSPPSTTILQASNARLCS